MNNFLSLIGGKPPGVGIEVNSERVNIVQLKSKGQAGYKLVNHATSTLDEGIVEEGRINDPIALGEIIRGLMSDNKIKAKKVATAVPGRETVSRLIKLPAEIPDDELREMVLNQEASLYLPFPREDADVDYQKLGTSLDDDGIERLEILMVATPREVTDMYLQTMEIAQLDVDIVEVTSFSIIRSLKEQLARFQTMAEAVAIVDIEYESTEITITVDGVPQFSRTVGIGTEQIQNAQLRAINLPPRRNTDMEMLSAMTVPIQTIDTAGLAGGSGNSPGDAAILRVLGDLSDELRRSIDFHTSQTAGSDVVQLLLVGPGACIGQLNEFFSQRLGIAVTQVDPLDALAVSADDDLSVPERMAMVVVLGLGIREA
ncbi:type IV pilus assembly protein PilM [Thalassoporum mexicanum PCC 7367]|uniref:type IV pilus assembly protein PilM n=1 Tax=Thalassoporum mexicanum TaxID=3457544 RepID=UPI00029FDFD9|nr:type IV pilus assembly protein PilM [Pseudanabaena sp. PCC 7367]AFY68357.1 type IV pilus assembly protein PilM [Pseudanabaena sp. PCC 7367]